MGKALHEIASMRLFARLSRLDAISDETNILNLRRLMETQGLAPNMSEAVNAHLARMRQSLRAGTTVDAMKISAPGSTETLTELATLECMKARRQPVALLYEGIHRRW